MLVSSLASPETDEASFRPSTTASASKGILIIQTCVARVCLSLTTPLHTELPARCHLSISILQPQLSHAAA